MVLIRHLDDRAMPSGPLGSPQSTGPPGFSAQIAILEDLSEFSYAADFVRWILAKLPLRLSPRE